MLWWIKPYRAKVLFAQNHLDQYTQMTIWICKKFKFIWKNSIKLISWENYIFLFNNTDYQSFELDLSGINIWSNAWSEAQVPDIASSCRPSLPADVFAWSEILIKPSDGITRTLRAPSACDGWYNKQWRLLRHITVAWCRPVPFPLFTEFTLW